MSVDGVNNSNNTGYAVSGMVLGAGAGAATGYLTKPFLKNGAPTDSFIKKMSKNMIDDLPKDVRDCINGANISGAKSVEELKNVLVANAYPVELNGPLSEEVKQALCSSSTVDHLKQLGLEVDADYKKKLGSAETYDDLRRILRENLDKKFSGKSLKEIKTSFKSNGAKLVRKCGKIVFDQYWDSSKNAFVNCEEGVGKAVKKAARSIQGKYAIMYGAIGAAVLGTVGYLCGGSKKNPEASQKVDMQV